MNVVVHKARHPQLSNYIHSATSDLLPFIEKVLALLPFRSLVFLIPRNLL